MDDPRALARLPWDSPPGELQLVRCSSSGSAISSSGSSSGVPGYGLASVDADMLALSCWSDRQASALAVCNAGARGGDGHACVARSWHVHGAVLKVLTTL